VELCRELFALQLLSRKELRGKEAKFAFRFAQDFLRYLSFSNISCHTGHEAKPALIFSNGASTVTNPTNRTIRLYDSVLGIKNISRSSKLSNLGKSMFPIIRMYTVNKGLGIIIEFFLSAPPDFFKCLIDVEYLL